MRRALIIINPAARGVANPARICHESQRLLAERGIVATVGLAPEREAATRAAQKAAAAGLDMVIAAGGDGVINRVAQGLAGTETALGFIPLGTGNSLGFEFGITPGDLASACDLIAGGDTRAVDLGLINGRVFVGIADIGLAALVQGQVSQRWKGRFGVAALGNRFLKSLPRVRPWQYLARLEGAELSGRMWGIFLLKGRRRVWRVQLDLPGTDDDGLLQVLTLRDCSRKRLLGIARELAFRNVPLAEIPEFTLHPAQSLAVQTCPPAPWEVDGEPEGVTPIAASVLPRALRLIVPR